MSRAIQYSLLIFRCSNQQVDIISSSSVYFHIINIINGIKLVADCQKLLLMKGGGGGIWRSTTVYTQAAL